MFKSFRLNSPYSILALGTALAFCAPAPVLAGDSTYGTITEVKTANLVVLDYGSGKYTVRLAGIDIPTSGPLATQGKAMVTNMILKKRVQIRFENKNESNEMVCRVLTIQTSKAAVSDIGEKLVHAGLARRKDGYDYKCGCLEKAENEAKTAKRGLWGNK